LRMATSSSSASRRERNPGVRRCLFGKPDPKEVDKWLDDMASDLARESSSKWSFDFTKERPLDQPGPAHPAHPIHFEAIPADKVPQFYRTRTYGKKVPAREEKEESPPTPTRSRRIATRRLKELTVLDEKVDVEMAGELPPSTSHPLRGGREKKEKEKEVKKSNLRQARITNYLPVRKRASMEKEEKMGDAKYRRVGFAGSSASSPAPAPSSPFRFADDSSLPPPPQTAAPPPSRMITRAISARNL
ncbi:hypothetical protein PFISCL1PPCAC_8157, partial [Pristionchus fissidentatus]